MIPTTGVLAFALALSHGATSSPSINNSSSAAILDRALTALGGEGALEKLSGVTYHAPKLGTPLHSLILTFIQQPTDSMKHLSLAQPNAELRAQPSRHCCSHSWPSERIFPVHL